MANIPTYRPPTQIGIGRLDPASSARAVPAAPRPVRVPAGLHEGAADAAAALSQGLGKSAEVAGLIAERQQRRQAEEAFNWVLSQENAFSDQWTGYLAEAAARTGQDTFNNVNDAEIWIEERKAELAESAPAPEAAQALTRRLDRAARKGISELARLQVKERRAVTRATLDQYTEKRRRDAYLHLAPPADLVEHVLTGYETAVSIGALDPIEAQDLGEKAGSEIHAAYLDGLIDRTPAEAVRLFGAGQFNALMTADQLDAYADRINQKKAEIEAEADRQRKVADEAAEEAHKAQIKDNEFGLLQEFHGGGLTHGRLEEMASKRQIGREAYDDLKKRLEKQGEGQAEENNPVVVGELGARIALGADVSEDLDRALHAGDIKPETYISMRESVADKGMRRAVEYVNDSLRPSPADRYDPGKHYRHANAVDELYGRVGKGEDPSAAAKSVVARYLTNARVRLMGLRQPKYLKGLRSDPQAVDEAMAWTARAWQNKTISEEAYQDEMRVLWEMRAIHDELKPPDESRLTAEEKAKIDAEVKKFQRSQ